jgi:hypothetical protein
MKANELRIGNYVNEWWSADKKYHVDKIDIDLLRGIIEDWTECQPIPLTEEWLLKFGFEHLENKSEHFNEQIFLKDVEDNGNIKTITVKILSSGYQPVTKYEVLLTNEYRWGEQLVGRVYWKDDLYVHQLQNLYFALTGEELTLKEI